MTRSKSDVPKIPRKVRLEDVRSRILALFKPGTPVLIGDVSMHLKCSLYDAETLLEDLVYENEVRLLTDAEAYKANVSFAYTLPDTEKSRQRMPVRR